MSVKVFDTLSRTVFDITRLSSHTIFQVATWSGNLMLIHAHKHFPSDIYLMFDAAGAKVSLGNVVLKVS